MAVRLPGAGMTAAASHSHANGLYAAEQRAFGHTKQWSLKDGVSLHDATMLVYRYLGQDWTVVRSKSGGWCSPSTKEIRLARTLA